MSEENQEQSAAKPVAPLTIEILEETENVLLKRKVIKFKIVHEYAAVPERLAVKAKLAAMKTVDASLVFIRKLECKFGIPQTIGTAHIYKDGKDALRLEPPYIQIRNLPKEARKDAIKAAKAKKKKNKPKKGAK